MQTGFWKKEVKIYKLKKTSYKQDNLFTGLIHCAEDKAAYWLKVRTVRGKAAKTWVCSHRIKTGRSFLQIKTGKRRNPAGDDIGCL